MNKKLKLVAVNLALMLAGAGLVEGGARIAGLTPASVDPRLVPDLAGKDNFRRGNYPQGYFTANEERGFDITPNFKPTPFDFMDETDEIFSNRFGCFDRNEAYPGSYVLLLGDSFTWGYAAYEAKWGTLLEKDLGVTVAKCGVTHTGQRGQLSKGRDLVTAIGHPPKLVVVAFFVNDPEDDRLYPRATVIDGYMTEQVYLKGGQPQKFTPEQLESRYRAWKRGDDSMKGRAKPPGFFRKNLVLGSFLTRLYRDWTTPKRSSDVDTTGGEEVLGAGLARNQEALAQMRTWASGMGSELLVVLIPTKDKREVWKTIYDRTKDFVEREKFSYIDVQSRLKDRPKGSPDLYWKYDAHLTPEGNRVLEVIVRDEIKKRYGTTLTAP